MGVKRRHFTSKQYSQESSSSSEDEEELDNGQEEEEVERQIKVSKLSEVKNEVKEKEQELYKVIETDTRKVLDEQSNDELEDSDGKSDVSVTSDGGSDSSDSDDDDDSDDSDEVPMVKPVFISKAKRLAQQQQQQHQQTQPKNSSGVADDRAKQIAMAKVEHNINASIEQEKARILEASAIDREELGDIDDTDDLDPEYEYNEWKKRELARLRTARQVAIDKEREEEEIYIRKQELDQKVEGR